MVDQHETLVVSRNQRKPKRFEKHNFWVNRKYVWYVEEINIVGENLY